MAKEHQYQQKLIWTGNTGKDTASYRDYRRDFGQLIRKWSQRMSHASLDVRMKFRQLALGVTVTFFYACTPSTPSTTALQLTSFRSNNSDRNEAIGRVCPSHDFNKFLNAFMAEESVQRNFTRRPYVVTEYDPQDLDAEPSTRSLDSSEVDFPLIISRRELMQKGVQLQTLKMKENVREVSTHSIGNGAYSRIYIFEKTDECWFLVSSTDAST